MITLILLEYLVFLYYSCHNSLFVWHYFFKSLSNFTPEDRLPGPWIIQSELWSLTFMLVVLKSSDYISSFTKLKLSFPNLREVNPSVWIQNELSAYYWSWMDFFYLLDLLFYLFQSLFSLIFCLGLKLENVHFFIKHLWWKPNVFSSFQFITRKHPYFDSSIMKIINNFWHSFLEFVFKSSCTK